MMLLSIWSLVYIFLFIFSFISFMISIVMLTESLGVHISWLLYSWGSSDVVFTVLLDWISFSFISFVFLISGSVFYYSGEYMEGELNMSRFIFILLAFVGSMGLLIFSPNMISLLLGWDGLGLISYCLVIYYQNYKSLNAGILTVLSNRVGDVFILVAIVYMLNYGDWSFVSWMGYSESLVLVSALLILATMTKSAQIPFSAWLPAAMAAPTPVSSLVHSSTLVTAGVYLVIRLGWVYDFWLNDMLMIVSSLTMFMAGLGACFEFDLKKVIALSTLSQLGLMMYSLSMGMVKVALFHLLMHALFKALLFMSAGSIIHGLKGWQDLRLMGGLFFLMPYLSSCFIISNMALAGLPFLAGFYSKDLILELSLAQELNLLSLLILFVATGLTVIYTFRLIYYVMLRDYIMSGSLNLSDGSGVMTLSCFFLTFFSIFFGALCTWLMMDIPEIFLPFHLKNLTLIVCLIGVLIGFYFSQSSYSFKGVKGNLYSFFIWFSGSMWFLPYLSSQYLIYNPLKAGLNYMKLGDMGWLEYYGGQGISNFLVKVSYMLNLISLQGVKLFIFLFWTLMLFYIFM
uniref:NADH-ubiquinone oxidoreductase chain 5 n=1 Tax=Glyptelasma annandalei TaxID=2590147 RepID=A0A4Y5UZ22_9CRUS|nr:NADH dehydrogenase subunit 5 [Glyptelasma annandalei]QDD68293.1 NADH dehydrogenase subunit 5 [Glyptelasma annandalei]